MPLRDGSGSIVSIRLAEGGVQKLKSKKQLNKKNARNIDYTRLKHTNAQNKHTNRHKNEQAGERPGKPV